MYKVLRYGLTLQKNRLTEKRKNQGTNQKSIIFFYTTELAKSLIFCITLTTLFFTHILKMGNPYLKKDNSTTGNTDPKNTKISKTKK